MKKRIFAGVRGHNEVREEYGGKREHLEWDEEKVAFPFHSQVLYHYGKPFKFAPCSQDLPSLLIKGTFGYK